MKNYKILALFLVFLLLRLYHLGLYDFWYDEAQAISYIQEPQRYWHAHFYWVFLKYWAKAFSISEASLRASSLIFSFLSLIVAYLLGKRIFNKRIALLATLIMGLSPFHIWYAQEARSYSMILFFGLLSSYLLLRASKEGGTGKWAGFSLVSVLGIYTHDFYIVFFIAQNIYAFGSLLLSRKLNIKPVAAFLLPWIGFALYLPSFLYQFFDRWQGTWMLPPDTGVLMDTFGNLLLGYNATPQLYLISGILTILVLASACIYAYKDKNLLEGVMLCMYFSLLPVFVVALFSWLLFPIYIDRCFIIFTPYFYLLLSVGISSIKAKYARAVCLALLITALLASLLFYYNGLMFTAGIRHPGVPMKKPIRPLVDFMEEHLGIEDTLVFSSTSAVPSFRLYSRRRIPYYYFFDPRIPDPNFNRPVEELGEYVPLHKIGSLGLKRIWLVAYCYERNGMLDANSIAVKSLLEEKFKPDFETEIDGFRIYRYVRAR